MTRVAVFVDAGYLFAQGSTALAGAKQQRSDLRLDERLAVEKLISLASLKAPDQSLLRVYWYDGAINYKGPTLEQMALAHLDNVKLRLGFINSQGQQKGVDSLIVTDLIDLARNHAISDAVLLSGDEDVRIGVQIAQNFGVRVHLVGIAPSRGSQSKQLMQEADTTTEWDREDVSNFLSLITTPPERSVPLIVTADVGAATAVDDSTDAVSVLGRVVEAVCAALKDSEVADLKAHWEAQSGVPPEFDGKLIARGRDALGRILDHGEKATMRSLFKRKVREIE